MATVRIQIRRGTANEWEAADNALNSTGGLVLAAGEMGIETDTNKIKIGNGNDRWDDLTYANVTPADLADSNTDYVPVTAVGTANGVATLDSTGNVPIAQLGNLIDGAPAALNTLNELAAALNDDQNYASTITSALSGKQDKITGVSDTEIGYLANVTSDIQGQIDSKLSSADLAETAQDAINNAFVAGNGISRVYDDNANTLTVSIDTSVTATTSYADTAAGDAQTAAEGYADDLMTQEVIDRNSAIGTAVSNHNNATTSVHGIADTSALATKTYADDAADDAEDAAKLYADGLAVNYDAAGAAASAENSANTYTDNELTAHNNDTTSVHGIADTTVLETQSGAQTKVDNHNLATAAHGVTGAIVGTSDSQTLTNKTIQLGSNTISGTIAQFNTAVTDANLATIDGTETLTNKTLTSPVLTGTPTAPTANANDNSTKIATTAYVETAVSNLIDAAPAALNTLNELAAALGDDANFATTVTNSLATKQDKVTGVSDTEIGYLDGVTSAIQDQIDSKASSSSLSSHASDTSGIHGVTGDIVGTSDTQTLTNKTINLASNTISGTTSEFNTALSDDSFATLTGAETLTNKTLTSPKVNENVALTATSTELNILDGATLSTAELNYVDGVTSNIQTQLDTKSPLANPTFTGTVSLPSTTSIGNVSATEIGYLDGVTSAVQTQINAKAPIESPTFTGTVSGITKSMVGLGNVDNTSDVNKPISTATQSALDLKAPLASPTFTGTVTLPSGTVTSAMIADGTIVDGDINASAAIAQSKVANLTTDLAAKAPLAGPTFTGTVVLPSTTSIGNVSSTEIGYLDGVTSAVQTQLDAKAPLASPTFTGTVSGITKSMVGLGNVDNTSDANKPISTATQSALDAKASLSGATFTGSVEIDQNLTVDGNLTVNGTTFSASSTSIVIEDNLVQLAHENVANTVDLGIVVGYNDGSAKHAGIVRDVSDNKWKLFKGVTTEPSTTVDFTQGSLDDLEVAGFTASSATIGDVSNTELQYLNGVTSAVQTQLDAKAPLASPTFTGTVTLPSGTVTSAMIADGTIVDGDISASAAIAQSKVSNLTTDLAAKAPLAGPTFTGTVTLPSTTSIGNVSSTEIGYLDGVTSAVQTQLDAKAPLASPTFTGTVSGITKSMVGLGNVDNTSDANKPISTATQSALDLKAPLASPTFTGTVTTPLTTAGYVKTSAGGVLSSSAAIAQADVTNLTTDLAAKAPLASPTFTGTVTLPSGTVTSAMIADGTIVDGDISASAAIAQSKVSNLTTDLAAKAPLAGPTFTGTVVLPSTTSIGNVSSTEIGYLDGVTSAVQTQLDAKAPLASPTFTGTVTLPSGTVTSAMIADGTIVDGDISASAAIAQSKVANLTTDLAAKANLSGATFTGAISATDLTLSGNLTVNGTTTNINSTNLVVEDKNVIIGDVATPSNTTADGGGITLKGATDKTFTWSNTTAAWTSSEDLNLASGKVYEIDGTTVLSSTQVLGKAVPSGVIVGTTDSQTLTNKTLTSPTISSIVNTGTLTLPTSTDTLVGRATTDTLTNKTIALGSNTVSGTVAQFNTALTDGDFATIAGTETLTNKTLTSPSMTSPTVSSGTLTVSSSGIVFTDGTQTQEGVPSRTTIIQKTAGYTLSAASERDELIEMNAAGAVTLTIPLDSTLNFPVGTSIQVLQTGAGQVSVAGAVGVTVNGTPGLKLRTQWSAATLFKRAANTWVVYGDLVS